MVSLIAAMTKERVIGREGGLPWHLPEDLQNFKRLTSDNVVIMGRKTYESIPEKFRPLPNRINVVVSSSMPTQEGIIVARDLKEAIKVAKAYNKEVFIIGGSTIYRQSLPLVDTMYISVTKETFPGDTYFPEFNQADWNVTSREEFETFTLKTYTRKQP